MPVALVSKGESLLVCELRVTPMLLIMERMDNLRGTVLSAVNCR